MKVLRIVVGFFALVLAATGLGSLVAPVVSDSWSWLWALVLIPASVRMWIWAAGQPA